MLQFHTAKYKANRVKVEKAFGATLTKKGFEALALKVARNNVIKGVDKTDPERYTFIGKVNGVYYKLVIIRKKKNSIIRGVSLFAFDDQNFNSVLRKAKNRIVVM